MTVSMLLTACGSAPAAPQVPAVLETPEGIREPSVTPQPKVMIVCTTQEPGSLYTLGGDVSSAEHAVLDAIYHWGIDRRSYKYWPNGIKDVPTLQGGDAMLTEVDVKVGDHVYDVAKDEVVAVSAGSRITLHQQDGSEVTVDFAVTSSAKTVQMSVTWVLQDGLTWEDGQPVTTDDILFAWNVATSPDTPGDKSIFERTASYTAQDSKTWTWVGVPGYFSQTYFLDALVIPLPKHVYGEDGSRPLSPADMLQDEAINHHPLAFGPFKVVEWVIGDHLTLQRNPTYNRAGEGLPKLDSLIFRFVPGVKQLVADLATGTCQLGMQGALFEEELLSLRQFQAQKLLNVQLISGTFLEMLEFNAMPAQGYTGFAGRARNADGTPVFANPDIRKAIAFCLDRRVVVDQIVNGAAIVQNSFVTDNHPLHADNSDLTMYTFDPVKGRDLLARNGWVDSDRDGILDNSRGLKFSIVYSARDNPLHQRLTEIIRQQLMQNCGIEVQSALYGLEYLNPGPKGILFGRSYDIAESTLNMGSEPACDRFISQNIPGDANWSLPNISGFSNPDFDAACTSALAAADNADKAIQHTTAQQIFTEFLPSLPLFARAKMLVTRPEVQGIVLDPTAGSELWNVENFDLVEP
jgi:peptide/nickel transport system substrate-binding protein